MDAITALLELAERPRSAAQHLKPLVSSANLNAHPCGHDNSIAWLLWHTAREIDQQVADLAGKEPVWTAQGFRRRFALDTVGDDIGYGQSAEQARSIVITDVELLFDHLDAAVQAQIDYIASLDDAALDEVVDEAWTPPVTRAARLVSCSEDALMHLGQASYVTGMPRP